MSKKNINEHITVTTKEELKNALKHEYGYIHIQGTLQKEVQKQFDKNQSKLVGGISGILIGGILALFPPTEIIGFIIYTPSLISLAKKDRRKSYKYDVREDMRYNVNDICIAHDKVIDEVRSHYKGVDDGYATNINELEDMVFMGVNKIKLSTSTYNRYIETLPENKREEFKKSDHFNKKYIKYTKGFDTFIERIR